MQSQTISLVKQQMQERPFPINTKVDIYHDNDNGNSLQSSCCTGFVEGGHLDIKNGSICDLFYEVRVTCNCCDERNRGNDMDYNVPLTGRCKYLRVCKETELRFSKGSPVTIQENEHSTNMKYGIVMGTVEVPNEINLAEGPSFWYSIYVPEESKVINEVHPDHVKCDSNQPEGQDVPHIIISTSEQSEASQLSNDKNDSDGNGLSRRMNQDNSPPTRERFTDHNNVSTKGKNDREQDMSIFDSRNKHKHQSSDEKKRNIQQSNVTDIRRGQQSIQKQLYTVKRQKPSETIPPSFDEDDKHEIWIIGNLPTLDNPKETKHFLQKLVNGNAQTRVKIIDKHSAKVCLNNQTEVDKCIAQLHNQVVLDGSKFPLRVVRKSSPFPPEDRESKLIVENLCNDDDEEKIKSTFTEYSDVATVSLIKDINGALLGAATVVFKDYRSKAIALRNKNALKPYNIIDPDPHSDQKARRKNVFKQTIPETLPPSRKAVSWSTEQNLVQLSQQNKNDTIVSPNNQGKSHDDSHRSNLEIQPQNKQKNYTNNLKPTKRSENFKFVAQIYIPLERVKLISSIIGTGGESVRDLERRTSCVINVNKDPRNGIFCAEVCSNEEFRALCGAEVLIEHVILKMGFQDSLRLKNDCYYHFFHNGELAKHENKSWRIHLPIHFDQMHGFVVGQNGSRVRHLAKKIRCRIALLRCQEVDACIIEILNDDVKQALRGTYHMLLKLEEKYRDQIVNGAKIEGGKARHITHNRGF